jgi:4-deoxy-L-threo-5-hexosulose-uronate ketol-isomerase
MEFEIRHPPDPVRFTRMNTAEMREALLLEKLFSPGSLRMVYSHVDRAIIGAATPESDPLRLETSKELAAEFFTQRRELGIINIGPEGSVRVEGKEYLLANRDALYVGRGNREVIFQRGPSGTIPRFYFLSYPAHATLPTVQARKSDAEPTRLGSLAQANQRTIYKYIHPAGIRSCQLVMGFTELELGSVWNTMPPHTHARRSEVYLYFDLASDAMIIHCMGDPQETRHLVVRDQQAVISPSWSIHAGVGTQAYTFVWAMGGENQEFGDMDAAPIDTLR